MYNNFCICSQINKEFVCLHKSVKADTTFYPVKAHCVTKSLTQGTYIWLWMLLNSDGYTYSDMYSAKYSDVYKTHYSVLYTCSMYYIAIIHL